jgi:hypothetical protein
MDPPTQRMHCGRKWEIIHTVPGQPQFVADWARQWQAAEEIAYSGIKRKA